MNKDQRLEMISDKIRHGTPVGMLEAIEAVEYQSALREHRKQQTLWARFTRWLRGIFEGELK